MITQQGHKREDYSQLTHCALGHCDCINPLAELGKGRFLGPLQVGGKGVQTNAR